MAPPKPTGPGLGHSIMKAMAATHVWLYRLTGGKIGGTMAGGPIVLLTTTGQKSGMQRTVPLLYLDMGQDALALVGSYAGADKPPAWLNNITKTPTAQVQVGSKVMRVNAAIASPQRKAELWPKLCAMYPDYQLYQDRTKRDIPVVLLTKA